MNKIKVVYTTLIVLCLASIVYTCVSIYSGSHFKCTAITDVKYKSQEMEIISHYSFDGDVGSLVVEGELTNNDNSTFHFIIKNIFNFERSNNTFYLTSKDIVTQPVNLVSTGQINEFLSQFFYKEQKNIVFDFAPQQPDAYIVFLGSFPVGYCKK